MSFLHAVPGKEVEFNKAVDEWEAFAATKRGLPDAHRFPFMDGIPKAVVPAAVSVSLRSPPIPTSGPAVFAPKRDATREELGASVAECYSSYAPGGIAAKRYAEIVEDDSLYMRMLRARFDLAVARAFGSKHIGICLKAAEERWTKDGVEGEEKQRSMVQFHNDMTQWAQKHKDNLAELEAKYRQLQSEAGEDGIDDGVDIDLLTRSIASGKMEQMGAK